MRRLMTIFGCLCAAIVFTGSPIDSRADDHAEPNKDMAGHKDHKHGPAKYIAHVHGDDGKEVEKKFDLSDKKQADELIHALKDGHVHELKVDEPPDLFAPKRWDLGLWSIGIFAVLMFVLTKFAWKPILSSMHEREERIRGAIEQAEKTRREADELHLRLQAEMNQAAGRVREMIDEARRDGDVLKAKMIEDAKTEIATERDRLRREIELAKDTALEEIWQQSVQLAALMSTKALRRELKPEDHRRLLDETLAEMRRSQSTRRA